jgi:CTP:molybdopterin cytidylyltransferase MocA
VVVKVDGLLLAAGQGWRMGLPKALVTDDAGAPWLVTSINVLLAGGCSGITVVLGAAADQASELLGPAGLLDDPRVRLHVLERTPAGMSTSLREGLSALADSGAEVALVHLVDLPDVTPDVVSRVLGHVGSSTVLARAAYGGRPGHPVAIGRDHWSSIRRESTGDLGAREFLAHQVVEYVECGDLATGVDVDER